MRLQRQHFLLSYFKMLSADPAGVRIRDLPRDSPTLNQLSHWCAVKEMVLCIVVGCGRKSGIHKAKFSKIPKIITNQGEEWEELTRERRNRWISAVSRNEHP